MPVTDFEAQVAAVKRVAPHIHPSLHNLFAMLPPPGEPFSVEQRQEFLKAARSLFTLIYGVTDHINGAPASIEAQR